MSSSKVLVYLVIVCLVYKAESAVTSVGGNSPLIIAHRGSSGELPDLTLEAFELAAEQGADLIELDICVTKDGKLVVIHDAELSKSTNIVNITEFASRNRSVTITTTSTTYEEKSWTTNDWFVNDFSMEEIKKLRKRQRETFRDPSYNDKYLVPSFLDVLKLLKKRGKIGLLAELKYPYFFNKYLNETLKKTETMEQLVLNEIKQVFPAGSWRPQIILQSFEDDCVFRLARMTDIPVIVLQYYGFPIETYLKEMKRKGVFGIGPWKVSLIGVLSSKDFKTYKTNYSIPQTSELVKQVHNAGLKIFTWTFRNEDKYLPWNFGNDPLREYDVFINYGIDGLITDFPATARRALLDRNSGTKSMVSVFTVICALVFASISR